MKSDYRPLTAELKQEKRYDDIDNLEHNRYKDKTSSISRIPIPSFYGEGPEAFRDHKRKIIDLVCEYEIYRFIELNDFFEEICRHNTHLSREKLMEIFDDINNELEA